jgi:hypothetical protein
MRFVVPAAIAALALGLLAGPAASQYGVIPASACTGGASFSGHKILFDLYGVNSNGSPAAGSHVQYYPAGLPKDLEISAVYRLDHDRTISGPIQMFATVRVDRAQAKGRFVLTVDGLDFTSDWPGSVSQEAEGKADVMQAFRLKKPLATALATGGPARLAFVDSKGSSVFQADITFAPPAGIQDAVGKAYPAAATFYTKKDAQC